jgi:hypothetical protein
MQGWRLGAGLAYGTSRGGPPDATVLWPGSSDGATQLIPDAVNLARGRQTTRLGHLLAPMAVRYIVIPAGAVGGDAARPLTAAMAFQVDMRQLQADDDVIVYENAAWAPARARLLPNAASASRGSGLDAARGAELAGSKPVLPRERSPFRFTGPLNDGDQILLSEASSPGWQLTVGGHGADRTKAFGWANSYDVGRGGRATLRYHTSPFRYVAIALEVVLWGVALRALLDLRRRRRDAES